MNRKIYRSIATLTIMVLGTLRMVAQDVIVNVTPVQQVLPPQVLLYVADPGKYFNISLTNTSGQAQQVYLGLQIEQTMPASDLSISTPPKRQPRAPFVIQPNATYQLSTAEMKHLFDHIPSSEISCPPNLFGNYQNGSFGLLPEGQYQIHITAYKWSSPQLANPVVVSNPVGGVGHFTVCYKAQAPQFLMPMLVGTKTPDVAEVDPLSAQFTWTQPVITCGSTFSSYTYSFKVVEWFDGQQPDDAMDRNPIVYESNNLMAPLCVIPSNVITTKFYTTKKYLAQVTARSTSTNTLNYVMLENNGKSTYRTFRIRTSDEPKVEEKPAANKGEGEKGEDKKGDDEQGNEGEGDGDGDGEANVGGEVEGAIKVFMGMELSDSISTDSLYTFHLPLILEPLYLEDNGARKTFLENSIKVRWREAWYMGGEGLQSDTIKIAYDVQLYNGGATADKQNALNSEPIYTHRVTEDNDSIPWDAIKETVNKGDYLVLRIQPVVLNGASVAFSNDSTNIIDFACAELLSKKYFECSNMVTIENTTPTEKTADELKGKVVTIGEYELTIDEIKAGKEANTWEGKGRVAWEPLGFKVGVCVEFSDMKINTDDIVYEGTAKSYAENESLSDMQVVDKLFSDWGIDNLIGDTGIPYAGYLQTQATNGVKDLAKKVNLSKYYGYVKKGQAVWNSFLTGEVERLYMPLALPKSVNKSPVDLQIVAMKFAPTHATMDVLGEFTLPDSKYTDNDILVLGAPRLCISPDQVIPESGTVALLSDFTIKDPNSSYTMTFKAPSDVTHPQDGCYIAWHDYQFEILGLDVDMKIPGLKKDVNGKMSDENPTLTVTASISDWDDWMVDNVNIDPFQAEDLPGWTFTASDIVYDHSLYRNSQKMGSFPTGYQRSKSLINNQINSWQGLYIKEISVKMPKSLEFGTGGDKRLEIAAKNMFFDQSGATLSISAKDVLSAKTGKVGGWSFSLESVNLSFIQNNFNNCKFNGKFSVPLLEGDIAYNCQILKLNNQQNSNAGNYAYIFKTQQVNNLSLDFFLAQATFDKKLTYFLVEAVPEGEKLTTRVELLMGGDLKIGGTDYLQRKANSLPIKFTIPGIHFSKMRIANCDKWESKYESELQNGKDSKSVIKKLFSDKQFKLGSYCYFNSGDWSLASPSKTLGPFTFTLDDYKFNYQSSNLQVYLEGSIKLVSSIDISAGVGLTIKARVSNLGTDISKISVKYNTTQFEKAKIDASFAGMTLKGELTVKKGDSTKGDGYQGSIEFRMPGDLFTVNSNGGYYEYKSGNTSYTWGFFNIRLGSATGLRLDPVVINSIKGGFYFNCKKKGDNDATPEKGIIGVIAGMGLSTTAGKDALSGEFEMTVVYDSTNKRLTTFMFDGTLKAVSGMVNAKASIVYQHDDIDQYFALNITVDASADGAVASKLYNSEYNRLSNTMKKLNSGYTKAVSNATGGLSDKLSDTSKSQADNKTNAKNSKSASPASASITLDFKVTMKEKGKKLNKVKWHVYLGEPDFKKRCNFQLINFKSSIVSVKIGANAYLCVGNELPNDGALPPIPAEVASFLDGSTKGSGMVSDDIAKANRARTRALEDFKADVVGGVMLGAQVYGYLDVDLGIIYGSMGATAGFDLSLRKLTNATCMNLGKTPGWNGWYGEGQLYAYLYAKFGIEVNLGFWSKRFDIVDAGIGGVLNMGGPNPNYFTGKARVKLRLLGGLVNVNRKFEFECGDRCDLFLGNALDNFELFGDCTLGDSIKSVGWDSKNQISPTLYTRPTIDTQAPLDEHFRVLDETELNKLAKDYDGDKADLEAQASRTFVFRSYGYVKLYEYTSKSSTYPTSTKYFYLKGKQRITHVIDMTQLNPNRYYKMEVTGWAKEISRGKEIDPIKYYPKLHVSFPSPWIQTKTYYFCTGPSKTLEDCPDLQEYVAIAYPSNYNQLHDPEGQTGYSYAYVNDIQNPTIALLTNLKDKSFKKGTLKWKLCNSSNQVLDEVNNQWVTTYSSCNMQPSRSFKNVTASKYYKLKLDYVVTSSQNGKVTTTTTNLMDLKLYSIAGTWREGRDMGSYRYSLQYEKPFIGQRINEVAWESGMPARVSDLAIAQAAGTKYQGEFLRLYDPYWYTSYLSNFAIVGGWRITNSRLSINATTSQSLIYRDKGGVYEGSTGKGTSYHIYDNYKKIRSLSIFDKSQWQSICSYPLPFLDENRYEYVMGGVERIPIFTPGTTNTQRVRRLLDDMQDVYYLTETMSKDISGYSQWMRNIGSDDFETKKANKVENWAVERTGVYFSATRNGKKMEVPAYQFPILWGSVFANKDSRKKVTMWGSFDDFQKSDDRPHENISEEIWFSFTGGNMDHKVNGSKYRSKENFKVSKWMLEDMVWGSFSVYRVNMYDYVNCEYKVIDGLRNGSAMDTFTIYYPLTK